MVADRALRCTFVLLLPVLLWTCGKAADSSGPPTVASQLAFKVSAGSTIAGGVITPAVVVEARDANGNLVPSFADPITVSLVRNPGNGTLSGTTTVSAVGGVATFANLSIDRSGSGYRLQATSGTLSSGSGSKFDILAGAPTHLAFAVEPGTDAAGIPIAPALQVTGQDSLGNVATSFTGLVTLAITGGTGTAGARLSGPATLAANAGVATFANTSLDKVGTGYTLTATTATLPSITSAPFDVIAGPAARVVFTQQPSTTTAGLTISPSVELTALDAVGNVATGFNGTITVSITSGTGSFGASLSGTKTVLAGGGVATLADLSINKSGIGYTLSADATGLVAGVSTTFDILTGPMSQLAFTVQPGTPTAGAPITPAVQVSARDGVGNTVTSFTDTVAIGLGANPTGGALGGTLMVAAIGGVATFPDLTLDKAGTGYRLQSTSGAWIATSNAFTVTGGTATQLAFLVQPTATGAGVVINPAVQVAALDALGNVATGYSGSVTVAIEANPGGGTLSGSVTSGAIGGVATFNTLSIDKLGTGYTLTAGATAGGLPATTSTPFDVIPGLATQLVFTVLPSTTDAGVPITPAIQVTARDALGNTATGFTGMITIAIGANPGGGGLAGTKSLPAVNGVATFTDLSIARPGTGYTLTAKATGLTTATSAPFDILIGPVSQLVFTSQPATSAVGTIIAPVQVTTEDAAGNPVTSFTGNVTVTIGVNPGGGTLSGTDTVAAVSGVATFNDLSINKIGTGYRLAVTSGTLTNTSNAFSIVAGPATHLVFTTQPVTTGAGAGIPAVQVSAQDALGNTDGSFTDLIVLAIGNNPSGGTLGGPTSVAAVAGVATFSGLTIDKIGNGYTLTAAAANLTGATSVPFNITAGGATQLVFTTPPTTTTAGSTITPAVQVTAKDALGNVVTGFTGLVTVAIGTNPAGGNLAGNKSVAAVAGVATFSDLSINRNGTGYTLTAKTSGLPTVTSGSFDILLGPVSQLVFTTQPMTTSAGTVISPPIQVTAEDGAGNTVTSFTGNVIMSIAVNPGSGNLSGHTTRAAVAGVATFNDLSIDKVGTGYRLLATSGAISNSSGAFSIVGGPAKKLVFTVEPGVTAAGVAIAPAVKVTALDSLGNTATSFTGAVAIAILTNPSNGVLTGTTPISAVAGVAVFSDLSINKLGTGYTLVATSSGLTPATSTPFNIVAGAATQLTFSVQPPTNTTAGATMTPAIKVTALDAVGNVATSFTGNVSIAIGVNPGGGTLSGMKPIAAIAGVATFSTLSIDKAGVGYTLVASASGVSGATSNTFTIKAGTLSQLGFTVPPSAATAGAAISPAVKVAGQDAFGNLITTFTGSVNVVITPGSGTAGATLSGAATVNAVAGVATFSTLSIDKAGADYRLTASSGVLTSATSGIFAINAGAAKLVTFDQQPTMTVAGTSITPAVTVTARDAFGNPVKTFAGNVTIAIAVNPSGATLNGAKTVAAVAGTATFGNLSINLAATGYRLAATSSGLTPDTSSAFSITAAAATKLAFTVQPVNTLAGANITPAVQVSAVDNFGNVATTFAGSVTVAIASGTGTSGAVLLGTLTQPLSSGVASFADLNINLTGTGYKLLATGGLTSATSTAFAIN